MDTVIVVDSCCDLSLEYIKENNLRMLGLTYILKGEEYIDDLGKTISHKEFYKAVREGDMPTTSQINIHRFTEEFKIHVKDGKSIIYIGFSSALSGCVNSANIARQIIMDEYKDADISIVDSKSACMGYGLLVMKACDMLKKGCSKEEIVSWLEENKLNANHIFTVDDLFHLKRGGRLSSTAALVGTILDIKPILDIDIEGRLRPISKTRGRKRSIETIAEMFKEKALNVENETVAVQHGDSFEDAEYLRELILKNNNVKEVIIRSIGPVIGSHAGPGIVGVLFFGEKRK